MKNLILIGAQRGDHIEVDPTAILDATNSGKVSYTVVWLDPDLDRRTVLAVQETPEEIQERILQAFPPEDLPAKIAIPHDDAGSSAGIGTVTTLVEFDGRVFGELTLRAVANATGRDLMDVRFKAFGRAKTVSYPGRGTTDARGADARLCVSADTPS
jgi:hypothetical protein